MTGWGPNSFVDDFTDFSKALKEISEASHPVVKKTAQKAAKKAGKKMIKDITGDFVEGTGLGMVSFGTQWLANAYVDTMLAG